MCRTRRRLPHSTWPHNPPPTRQLQCGRLLWWLYTGASGGISATVSHIGSRVVISTSAGFVLVGGISNSGNMRLCDSDREDWTGGATTTSIRLADHYMDGSGVLVGTDVLVLKR